MRFDKREYFEGYERVKQKLRIGGIAEIEAHGITDFSLRRVASSCSVSCAAPYKHFKSKEDFIAEIVLYIHNKWLLFQNQVAEIFKDDIKKQLIEICVAYVKFWIANPNFRSVLTLKTDSFVDERLSSMSKIADTINLMIHECCVKYGIDTLQEKSKAYKIRSFIYGAALMIDLGELENSEETINVIRECINNEF